MRKALLLFMLLGLVGLMYGCELETTTFSVKDTSDIHNKKEVKKSLRKLKSTGNCKECLLIGADISGKDLTHKNLARANLAGANLTEANLTEADLTEADLTEATLTEVTLSGANLKGTNLKNTKGRF